MKTKNFCSCLIIAIAALFLANGCGDSDAAAMKKAAKQFGTALDGRRQALRILPVPPKALARVRTPTSLDWFSQDSESVHKIKTITYKADLSMLESEVDVLIRPCKRQAAKDEPTGEDSFTITTTYSADGGAVARQTATLEIEGKPKTLASAEEIDKMLKEWTGK